MVPDNAVQYSWEFKRWTPCSKTCGGGIRMTRYGCRRNADGKSVPRKNCETESQPPPLSKDCYLTECPQPIWVAGEWSECSKSCGKTGTQTRSVSCVQPQGDGQFKSIRSRYCNDERPESRRHCNRNLCPAEWRLGPWSQCSVTCGNGTQERPVLCHTRDNTIGLCLDLKPAAFRPCRMDPCLRSTSDFNRHGNFLIQWLSRHDPKYPVQRMTRYRCHSDRSTFCRMDVLQQYCSLPSFQRLCCKSCRPGNSTRTTSKPLSATTKPNKGRLSTTTTRSPTRTTTSTRSPKTSTTTLLVSTERKDPTSVSTPLFYTSVAISTDTLGYTSAPDHQYTTTHNQVHTNLNLLSEESTTFVITTTSPSITSPSVGDMTDLSLIPSTTIPLIFHTTTLKPNLPSTTKVVADLISGLPKMTFTTKVPTFTSDPTPETSTFTTLQESSTAISLTPAKTTGRPKKVDETSENNAIHIPLQTVPLDNGFSQNNIVSRRRFVFLRERTRNKRIQELLEEKRNFLRRMKRAQGI